MNHETTSARALALLMHESNPLLDGQKNNQEPYLPGRSPLRVLMVERSHVAREVLEQVLQASFTRPLEVTAVNSPGDWPGHARGWELVLVDIDHDTEAACSLLRRTVSGSWRVATTLYDDEDRLLAALKSGVHGYLLKQDRVERQIETLQRIVMGIPDITPAMARGLLQESRATGQQESDEMLQTLSALSRGASVREAARELGRTVPEIQAIMAQVYRSIGQMSTP